MSLIGKSQQFLVTTAVAKGNQFVFLTMAIDGEDAIHLLLSVTVLGKESPRQTSIFHFHLSSHDLHLREKGCTQLSMLALTISTSAASA